MASKKRSKKGPYKSKAAEKKEATKKVSKAKTEALQAREAADAALKRAAQAERVKNMAWLERLKEDPGSLPVLQARMIEDLKRVYNTPHKMLGRTAGRDRYRELGHFAEVLVKAAFGSHKQFRVEAHLADTPTESKGARRAAKLAQEQKVHRYYSEVIKPFATDPFVSFQREKPVSLVVQSDHHSLKVDPFAMRVVTDFLAWAQPDMNVFNGDTHEFQKFGTHKQMPGHFEFNAQEEVDFCVEEIYVPCINAAPNARHVWVMGNHDYRYVRYLADNGTELACFRSMNLIDQFRLRELDIDLVCRANFLAPTSKMRKKDTAENWLIVEDCFAITHGLYLGESRDKQHYERFQMSGTNGHKHEPGQSSFIPFGQSFHNSLSQGAHSWTTSPMMAGHAVGRDYVSLPSQWQMGFVYVTIDPVSKHVQQHIITIGDTAHFGNRVWRITDEEREARLKAWEV